MNATDKNKNELTDGTNQSLTSMEGGPLLAEEKKAKARVFGDFMGFFRAVLTLDFGGMGVRHVLAALVRFARRRGREDAQALETMLRCWDALDQLETPAKAGDPVAFWGLLCLAVSGATKVSKIVQQNPAMVKPLARASAVWPIVLTHYTPLAKAGNESAEDRIRKLGFGTNVQEAGFRGINNRLSLMAALLHVFATFRAVVDEDDTESVGKGMDSETQAKSHWAAIERPILDGSVPKLSDIQLDEVNGIRTVVMKSGRVTTKGRVPEVSGDVREAVKKWFLLWRKVLHGWTHISSGPDGGEHTDGK